MQKKYIVAILGITVIALFFAISVFALAGKSNVQIEDKSTGNVAAGKDVTVKLTMSGYNYVFEPASVNVGDTVKLVADMTKIRGCFSTFVIPDLGIKKTFTSGSNEYTFVASKPGTFRTTCGMGMAGGQFVVKDLNGNAPATTTQNNIKAQGSSCGQNGGCGCGGI